MIRFENISIGYGENVLVEGVTARISQGRMVCLIGRNGVGKSTLLRTIAGFQRPLAGGIFIRGGRLADCSAEERARLVGIVLTERPQAQYLTIRQMVRMGRTPYTGFFGKLSADDEAIADEAMRQVGVSALAERPVTAVSDGELQKAMVAKALAQQTPVILLDEPTAFLDFESKVALLQLLRQLAHNEGKTILLSTHDINLAMKLADELWLMQDGTINTLPTAEDVMRFVGDEAAKYL